MSTEISLLSQCQLVPAYGSSSDSDDNMDDNSSPTATYEDLVRNADLFWDTLKNFLALSHKSLK